MLSFFGYYEKLFIIKVDIMRRLCNAKAVCYEGLTLKEIYWLENYGLN